jgi:hypothetical protein
VLRRFAYTIESRLHTEQEHIQARPAVFDLRRSPEWMIAAHPVRGLPERIHPIKVKKVFPSRARTAVSS